MRNIVRNPAVVTIVIDEGEFNLMGIIEKTICEPRK